jgi:uracil-DNA glycosylase family 4
MSLFIEKKTYNNDRPRCNRCGLFQHCSSPKLEKHGNGRKEILIVFDRIDVDMDDYGTYFYGKRFTALKKILDEFQIDIIQDCWTTSVLACFSSDRPTPKEIEFCFPKLNSTINKLKPKLILLIGIDAVHAVVSQDFPNISAGNREKEKPINRWRGLTIPSERYNTWMVPIYNLEPLTEDEYVYPGYDVLFRNDAGRALSLLHEPLPLVDYKNRVQVLHTSTEIERVLNRIKRRKPEYLALDFETNMLNPFSKDAEVYSASVCYSEDKAYSFPMLPGIASDFLSLVSDPEIKLIAHNAKMEDKWLRVHYLMNNIPWYWDTMDSAHIIDNRSGITGLKMQAFVNFGIPDYSQDVKQYLESPNPNTPNRIREANPSKILVYGGYDSLITYLLYKQQKKIMERLHA